MKKYDLSFLVASLLLGGVSFLGVAIAAGLFTPLTLAGTNLALIGWALLVVAPLVDSISYINTFERY